MDMSLLVVGSMAYDSVETPLDKADDVLGGSAMFFSAAASYFTPVNLVAVVGEDFNHHDIEFLKHKNVNLDGLTVEQGKTFRWKGKYLQNMNDRETIYTHLNVFEKFNPVLPDHYRDSKFVFLANISPDLQYNVVQQVQQPHFVAMDTMNFWISGAPESLKQTLSVVDALFINDSEAKELAQTDNVITAARKIQQMGPGTVIIKKGEHGAMLIHENSIFFCPAYPVENLFDPTGAGDTFAGGFMGYIASKGAVTPANLQRAMLFATALASFNVEAFSVDRVKNLSKNDIIERVLKLRDMIAIEEDEDWLNI